MGTADAIPKIFALGVFEKALEPESLSTCNLHRRSSTIFLTFVLECVNTQKLGLDRPGVAEGCRFFGGGVILQVLLLGLIRAFWQDKFWMI